MKEREERNIRKELENFYDRPIGQIKQNPPAFSKK